ncbi:MAG: VCBS repeat-containing protein, partial [Saprospiraceae bacterium]|nr:VCBS repeat-containing protein [Saprospiraceae bacterium]
SGGNEFREGQAPLQPRLYLNDGRGGLTRAADAFPGLSFNGSCVAPADFDGDGDIDLFMGGRTVPWSYGVVPRSYLLENDGNGKFRDVSAGRAPGLEFAGLVKAAVWTDLDGDRVADLALIGDWMPLRIFFE